jgi:DNA-directed RNA polymerase subunit RPC12/RpoP
MGLELSEAQKPSPDESNSPSFRVPTDIEVIEVPESDSDDIPANSTNLMSTAFTWLGDISESDRFSFSLYGVLVSVVKFPLPWISVVLRVKHGATSLRPDGVSRLLHSLLGISAQNPDNFANLIEEAGQCGLDGQTNYLNEATAFLARAFPLSEPIPLDSTAWLIDVLPAEAKWAPASDEPGSLLEIYDTLLSLELVHLRDWQENVRNGGECQCCFEQCLGSEMIQCTESHRVCKRCVIHQVQVYLSEGRTEFGCPAIGCNVRLSRETIGAAIPIALHGKVLEMDALRVLAETKADDIVKCAHCGTPVAFDGLGVMKCPICAFETCSSCGCAWHEGPCSRLNWSHAWAEAETARVIAVCPKCGAEMLREDGDNLIQCPICGVMMCDCCHEIIASDVRYEHFWQRPGEECPRTACPLWSESLAPQ